MSELPVSSEQLVAESEDCSCAVSGHHVVQFYETESSLTEAVIRFLIPGMQSGNPVVIVATPDHTGAFLSRLTSEGIDTNTAQDSHQLMLLDASDTLSRFMAGDLPDPDRFNDVIGGVLEKSRAGRGNLPVLAFGEMVNILWRQGRIEAVVGLEQL